MTLWSQEDMPAPSKVTQGNHCQPGRHPQNVVIRPDIKKKVRDAVARHDAMLAARMATLPIEDENHTRWRVKYANSLVLQKRPKALVSTVPIPQKTRRRLGPRLPS